MGDNIKGYLQRRNNRGSALVFIVIAFLIVTILASSVLFIFNTNLKQAKHQEYSLEAYYLAYSGVEMAFSAITENSNELLNQIINGATFTEDDIDFGRGKIDIVAAKTEETNFLDWIKISATGTLDSNNQSYTRSMYVNPSNTNDFVWVNN